MPARIAVTMIAAAAAIAFSDPTQAQTPATPLNVTPTPLPPAANPDTPGGAARNGVITPPATGADAAINRGAPAPTTGTPVIPPPGSPGGNPTIIPK